MPVTLGATYVVKLFSFCNNQLGLNVLHYRVDVMSGVAPSESSVAIAMEAAFQPVIVPLLSSQANFMGVNVQQILPLIGLPVRSTILAAQGTSGTPVLPKQICGLVTKRTDLGGRHNRGRIYIPFPSEADNFSQGTPEAAYITALGAFGIVMASARNVGASTTFVPIVFRKDAPALSSRITGYTQSGRWANQHRRGDFGALNLPVVPG